MYLQVPEARKHKADRQDGSVSKSVSFLFAYEGHHDAEMKRLGKRARILSK